jgi:hypothetical protein
MHWTELYRTLHASAAFVAKRHHKMTQQSNLPLLIQSVLEESYPYADFRFDLLIALLVTVHICPIN